MRAIEARIRPRLEEQNARVKRALAGFLEALRNEGRPPERFYLGNPHEPDHLGYRVFRWEKSVVDGVSVAVNVVVWRDGRVSFGDHVNHRLSYGSDSEVLPFHLGGDPGWSPLSAGWCSKALRDDDPASLVATADWFVNRLGAYLEGSPDNSRW
jgi:hypothetical protein